MTRRPATLAAPFPTTITIEELDQGGDVNHRESRHVRWATATAIAVRGEPALGAELRFDLLTGESLEWPGRFQISPRARRALGRRQALASMAARQGDLFAPFSPALVARTAGR